MISRRMERSACVEGVYAGADYVWAGRPTLQPTGRSALLEFDVQLQPGYAPMM
jgi:hypothetical protein